jgi:hypothetical protein
MLLILPLNSWVLLCFFEQSAFICLCLGAFVAILLGLSGFRKEKDYGCWFLESEEDIIVFTFSPNLAIQ